MADGAYRVSLVKCVTWVGFWMLIFGFKYSVFQFVGLQDMLTCSLTQLFHNLKNSTLFYPFTFQLTFTCSVSVVIHIKPSKPASIRYLPLAPPVGLLQLQQQPVTHKQIITAFHYPYYIIISYARRLTTASNRILLNAN